VHVVYHHFTFVHVVYHPFTFVHVVYHTFTFLHVVYHPFTFVHVVYLSSPLYFCTCSVPPLYFCTCSVLIQYKTQRDIHEDYAETSLSDSADARHITLRQKQLSRQTIVRTRDCDNLITKNTCCAY
jgi:hypothetical protein